MPTTPTQATRTSAMCAVLMLPAVVAGVIPVVAGLLDPRRGAFSPWGVVLVGLGVLVVVWTVRDFFIVGRGTLAPWDPPRELVTVGLFARCRNPMYVGVLIIVAGWAISFWSLLVGGYAVLIAITFHVRVLLHEEPWAAKVFPDEWPAYCENVPRWVPLLRRRRTL